MNETSDNAPFRNPQLPVADRVEDLVARLTLEEKVGQTLDTAPAIDRLGVPEYNWWNECLHGVARAGKATVFPQAIGLAATFNDTLVRDVADAISDEARAKHHDALGRNNRRRYFGLTFWSPNINIFRDPRWGRGQETYGEDPYLTARLGVAFVRGLQGDDPVRRKVDATAKHFAVHSGPESQRHSFNAEVNQRDLYETYLPAFKACVQEGQVAAIMGAYNRTNGEPCCASPTLLQKILREEWGFDGYVVSDCGAIHDIHAHHHVTANAAESAAMAIKNGCDLNCGCVYNSLIEAVDAGLISESEIDVALRRVLTTRFELGMFDPAHTVSHAAISTNIVNCADHRALARRAAAESIVLLKNDGILPLNRDKLGAIAVVGPNAMSRKPLLANYYGHAPIMITPFDGILDSVAPGTHVHYVEGCGLRNDRAVEKKPLEAVANDSDVIIAVMGFSPELEGEEGEVADSDGGGDRNLITLPGRQEEMLRVLAAQEKPVVLVIAGGSPIDLSWAHENVAAIVNVWYPGEQGGTAIADILFGDVNPAGRLPVTYVKAIDQLPPFADYSMQGRTYRFMDQQPLFHFGYGLSYTTFEYQDVKLSRSQIREGESVTVEVRIRNVGERDGDEVVQLYVRDREASVPVPRLHLEGFRRVHVPAGQSVLVTMILEAEQLVAYDENGNAFLEEGEFDVYVGGGQPEDPAMPGVHTTLSVVPQPETDTRRS
ncbi:MAG: glycoside hydrolase family 3 N-terminal domain-containing protein [Verrucomicrobiota bacterium]